MPSVTRKPQASRQERREQIERQLLDATERLMADGASFTELSVDRLATEAGISRASFYIYFEDKGDLLRRLAGQVFDDLAAAAERWWGVSRRRDPADVLAAMSGLVASYRHHQPLLVALNEMAAYDAAGRRHLSGHPRRHREPAGRGHRGGPGRRLHPPRAVGGNGRQHADLDGRANLPAEPAWPPCVVRRRAGRDPDPDRLGRTVSRGALAPASGLDAQRGIVQLARPRPGRRRARPAGASRRAGPTSTGRPWSPIPLRRRPRRRARPPCRPGCAARRRRRRGSGRTPR